MRSLSNITKKAYSKGFTLIEMMVIAPIVILLIGSFITLIVTLTGEVMSSRGSNVLTYDIQNALNRIESDVKLSTTFLAVNNIDVSATKQGYGSNTSTGSTVNFTNINKTGSGGSSASIVLNSLVTNGNPISSTAGLVYLANKPNACDDYEIYSKNTPMTMNIVYFVDANNTLWRRVIMPSNYAATATRCGEEPWQIPSCVNGYNPATLPFCKSNDEKLVEGVTPADFNFSYFPSASSTIADPTASNTAVTNDATRTTALQSTPTIQVTITSNQTVAGRDISRNGTVRVSRLDTNASSIAKVVPVTAAPKAPIPAAKVSDGHNVTFTWPRVAGASSYDIDYRINSGAWQTGATDVDNNSRSFIVSQATHTDTVEARVRAKNSFGPSTYGTESIIIPLWAPLILSGNWTDYGGEYSSAAYTKTKAGLVMFKGLVKNSGSPAVGDIIGLIPDDYKPSGRLMFGVSTAPNASARIDMNPLTEGGQVVFSDSGSPTWISLETIRYIPEETTYTRIAPALQNTFINYGGSYAPASYVQDSSGRVNIQGLLNNGTRTNGTVIFAIPAALQPSLYEHHASRSGSFHHLGIAQASQGGGLLAKGDGTGAYSINTSYLPASYTGTWTNLTLQPSWTTYNGATFATPQYTKTNDNVVYVKGLIGTGPYTYDTVIAMLPAGFRPKSRILYTTAGNGGYARLDVLANGQIRYMGTAGGWYSLDGLMFVAEQ